MVNSQHVWWACAELRLWSHPHIKTSYTNIGHMSLIYQRIIWIPIFRAFIGLIIAYNNCLYAVFV